MTLRALLIGLAGAFFIACFGYVNDSVFMLEKFTSGHLLPVIVVGPVILVMLTINPLLTRCFRGTALRPAEMTLVAVLMMASCSVPGSTLMGQFLQVVTMPHHWNRITPGWKEDKLLDCVPHKMLVDPTDYEDSVARFITGSTAPATPDESWRQTTVRAWERVPWAAWRGPLTTWLPLILLTGIASTCLALIVHRQWSNHEHLRYPIADIVSTLIQRGEGEAYGAVYKNRLFWIGFLIVFLIRVENGLYIWFPDYLIRVPLSVRLYPFADIWPSLVKDQWGRYLLNWEIFPLAIAIAYFLSSEIAFTLGVSQLLWVLLAIPMINVGVNLSTEYGKGGWSGWQRAGSYVAVGLMLLYTGRHYYRSLLVRALQFWRRLKPGESNVWACRVLIVTSVLLVALICRLGLEWPFAALTVLLMLLSFVVVARIGAETGLFYIDPRWQPFGILLGLFGSYTMGPQQILICALACLVLCLDNSQALMPYLTNGLKICENAKLSLPRVSSVAAGMYVVAVVLAIVVALCAVYTYGTPLHQDWSYRRIPTMPFRAVEKEVLWLQATDLRQQADTLPWYKKISHLHPARNFLWAAGFGFVMVLIFSVLRLRLPWWPLHPVLLLVWATWPMAVTCHSFFMGWLIKASAVKFGGVRLYQKLKPFMVGIIAAEILAALGFMILGATYFACTGEPPLAYQYFPH